MDSDSDQVNLRPGEPGGPPGSFKLLRALLNDINENSDDCPFSGRSFIVTNSQLDIVVRKFEKVFVKLGPFEYDTSGYSTCSEDVQEGFGGVRAECVGV